MKLPKDNSFICDLDELNNSCEVVVDEIKDNEDDGSDNGHEDLNNTTEFVYDGEIKNE